MFKNWLSKISQKAVAERIALCLAFVICSVLAIAAWGKFFHPAEFLKKFDKWVSIAELLFIISIFAFRKRWQLWAVCALVFAGWCGYAVYWYCLDLPCSCMGTNLDIPTILSICLDVLFFSLSLFMAYLLGAGKRWIIGIFLLALAVSPVGYLSACWVYKFFVAP